MINGKANNTAAMITQTDRSAERWKKGACYDAVPMKEGASPNNKMCQWYSNRVLQVFILMLKTFLGQTRVCACRYRAAKCCHITTDVIYCSSLRTYM
jgi:hypothetical protein